MTKEAEGSAGKQQHASETDEQTVFKIEGVPLLRQPNEFWCGYTSLSMVLQHWFKKGYLQDLSEEELSPEAVFEEIHNKKPDKHREKYYPAPRPTLDTLALAAEKISAGELKAILITERQHEALRKRGITAHEVLRSYIMNRETPCMVRIPGHFRIATGVDNARNTYFFSDSWYGEMEESATDFHDKWASRDSEPGYPRDTRYAMLVLVPNSNVV